MTTKHEQNKTAGGGFVLSLSFLYFPLSSIRGISIRAQMLGAQEVGREPYSLYGERLTSQRNNADECVVEFLLLAVDAGGASLELLHHLILPTPLKP